MAEFNYTINITGDCENNSAGSISVLPFGGTPPYIVQWVNPALGTDGVSIYPSIRTGLNARTYTIRMNDSTLPTNLEFYVNIPVSDGICTDVENVQDTTCSLNNGSISASSTSDYSSTIFYLYNSGGTLVSSATTNTNLVNFTTLTAGTYQIVVQDLGGCTGQSQTIVIQESTPFDFGYYVVPNSACQGTPIGKIYITGQTGYYPYTYLWNNGQTGDTITGLTEGTYSVQVTDYVGCTKSASIVVPKVDPLGFGNFVVSQPGCFQNNGTATLTVTGGTVPYFYSASTGFFKISYSSSVTVTGLTAGAITIAVTDSGFCRISETTELITPNGMSSVSINSVNSSCSSNDGAINISVVGGSSPYTYTLIYPTSNTTSIATLNTSYDFTNLTAGTYTVVVTDSSGCSYQEEETIFATNKFDISVSSTGTTCGVSNGVVSITKTSGGTSPFDYILDNTNEILDTTQSAVTFNNVSSGVHTISVIDADGCTISEQFFVESSQPISYSLYSTTCGTGSGGTITAFISDGEPPFTFNWSSNVPNNPQTITVTGLTAGTYSVSIVDSEGCSLQRTEVVTCSSSYISYQIYSMGSEQFQITSGTKCGLLQMLNQGFYDLTTTNTGCTLSSATFTARVMVDPAGDMYTNEFFTTSSLLAPPSDNLWITTVRTLLLSIPGIQTVIVDEFSNQITIQAAPDGPLNNQEITVDLLINYNIICEQ